MFNKELAIKQKNIIQDKAVQLLYQYRRILLSWATGCGKTLASLKMIHKYHNYNPKIKGYIICKESNHLNNWEDDIKEHHMEFVNSISDKFLYASLHKYSDKGFVDFVILDECHAITQERFEHLKKIIGPNTVLIMLSATVNYIKGELLRNITGEYHEYNITISEAIEMNILPPPKVYIHKFDLDNSNQDQIYIMTKGKEELRSIVKCNYNTYSKYYENHANIELHVECSQLEAYALVSEEIDFWGKKYFATGEKWMSNKWVNFGSKRKRMMAEMKTSLVKNLLDTEFKDSRYICFTGSKDQAQKLNRYNYVHSGRTKKANLKKKESFNSGKINNLFVVNMFREAMNLEKIDKGLITQLDNVKLSFIQMLGRVFRSQLPEMHIIIWKNTQDEKYLSNVIEGFNMDYVEIINY